MKPKIKLHVATGHCNLFGQSDIIACVRFDDTDVPAELWRSYNTWCCIIGIER